MSKVIIYDFEIFRLDSLLGANIIDESGRSSIYQTWDLGEMKVFYQNHQNDLWIGHNNYDYDDKILDAIVHDEDPFVTSQKIVSKTYTTKKRIKLYSIDLMRLKSDTYSLKLTELLCGKNIHTTEVDFMIKRKLTDEEKEKTERYNRSDLIQTAYNYNMMFDLIKLRLDIIKEFKLDFKKSLDLPGYILAANILNAKYTPSLKYSHVEPIRCEQLQIKNKEVLNYYYSKNYLTSEGYSFEMNGIKLTLGGGGIHGALNKYNVEKVLYIDVKGYYNLLSILYNLFPRNLSDDAKAKYKHMYETQLELKKTNPVKRELYKVILLAITGSMKLDNSPFYDPEMYALLTCLGQLFIIDLLEKVEPYTRFIQANTDGIMLEPYDWNNETTIVSIVNEWINRTGFEVKIEHLYNLWQRDVNTYCCFDENNNVIYKGDVLKNYDIGDRAYASQSFFKCKEPPIIAQGIINFLLYDIEPEVFIRDNKTNLKLFQYACSKGGFDYTTYDTKNYITMEHTSERLQGIDRVFAFKSNEISGMVYKHKSRYGKVTQSKYPSIPENVFVYNGALNEVSEDFYSKIDYQYYVNRIYQKIRDFVGEI